jgi:hypothetical protein
MEDSDRSHIFTLKEWFPDRIITSIINKSDKMIESQIEEANGLGYIPICIAYSQRSPKRGVGVSEIDDIADLQRAIYNEYSEIEQTIRINGHPSLVKTSDTEAVAGAGSIVQIPDTLDPGLKPYLLQPTGNNISAIYESISKRVEAIDRMANLGSARAIQARTLSGVAMETEFQMLNARLSDKADNLQLAEEHIWTIWADYQGLQWDGEIDYPDSFHIQDKKNDTDTLIAAVAVQTDPEYVKMLQHQVMEIVLGEEQFDQYLTDPMTYQNPIPVAPGTPNEVQQQEMGITQQGKQ